VVSICTRGAGSVSVYRSAFVNNTAEEGGAICCDGSGLAVDYGTFVKNAGSYAGGGALSIRSGHGDARNCVFWGNTGGTQYSDGYTVQSWDSGTLTLTNCVIDGDADEQLCDVTCSGGTQWITESPFTSGSDYDYHLSPPVGGPPPSHPCIGTGTAPSDEDRAKYDLDGDECPCADFEGEEESEWGYDIGADEWNPETQQGPRVWSDKASYDFRSASANADSEIKIHFDGAAYVLEGTPERSKIALYREGADGATETQAVIDVDEADSIYPYASDLAWGYVLFSSQKYAGFWKVTLEDITEAGAEVKATCRFYIQAEEVETPSIDDIDWASTGAGVVIEVTATETQAPVEEGEDPEMYPVEYQFLADSRFSGERSSWQSGEDANVYLTHPPGLVPLLVLGFPCRRRLNYRRNRNEETFY